MISYPFRPKCRRSERGFTLVELLVVIAIIGVLAAIVLASLDAARVKGRDGKRVSDVNQIRLVLELFYDVNGYYPNDIYAVSGSISPAYISTVPKDPMGINYNYMAYNSAGNPAVAGSCVTSGSCPSYHIGATLGSSGNSALKDDADGASKGAGDFSWLSYTAEGTACNTTAGAASPGTPNTETCYDKTHQ